MSPVRTELNLRQLTLGFTKPVSTKPTDSLEGAVRRSTAPEHNVG
jgi:hypothetical protein